MWEVMLSGGRVMIGALEDKFSRRVPAIRSGGTSSGEAGMHHGE